jgi:phosphoribosylanthranilate isomerase
MDAYDKEKAGGTGEIFDWDLAVSPALTQKVILSGGLKPDNVAKAIRRVRPYAVDVSSGIETTPGIKDKQKLKAFMKAVEEA